MPELMEISGLDGLDQAPEGRSPLLALLVGAGAVVVLGVVLPRIFGAKKATPGLGELGVIKKCRTRDLKSDRPRSDQRWCLWTQNVSRILGRHPTRERAQKQERLVQMRKHGVPVRR